MNLINLAKPTKQIKKFYCSAGSKTKVVFKYVYDEKYACPRRVANGEVSIDDMIQSYADDVDFSVMGKMLVANKDNVLDHFILNGEIQDVTGLPRNIHEYEYLHNKMKEEYQKLPTDLQNIFGSFEGFRNAWSENRISSILDTYYKSFETPSADEGENK